MRCRSSHKGYSLLELLIAMSLSAVLLAGIAALVGSSVAAYRRQLDRGQMEETGRFVREAFVSHVAQAGYDPRPWQSATAAVTPESAQGATVAGDQVGLQRWSAHNCFGNPNPVTDADGRPEFYLLQARFQVRSTHNLAVTCRYGPDASHLVTQVNNFGLAENVESLQVLYAEDRNGDGLVDGWVPAQAWSDESRVLAVKAALLIASAQASHAVAAGPVNLLDETYAVPADGRLRRVSVMTAAIRGRLK